MGVFGPSRVERAFIAEFAKHFGLEQSLIKYNSANGPMRPSLVAEAMCRAEQGAFFHAGQPPFRALVSFATFEVEHAAKVSRVDGEYLRQAVDVRRAIGWFPRHSSGAVVGPQSDESIQHADRKRREFLVNLDNDWLARL